MVPIDAPLLVAAALALAVALRGSKMPSWLVTTLRPLAYPMILLGIVALVVSLEDVYMLRRLGEPKGFYELAGVYPLRVAFLDIARGIGLLALAFLFLGYARRRKVSVGK